MSVTPSVSSCFRPLGLRCVIILAGKCGGAAGSGGRAAADGDTLPCPILHAPLGQRIWPSRITGATSPSLFRPLCCFTSSHNSYSSHLPYFPSITPSVHAVRVSYDTAIFFLRIICQHGANPSLSDSSNMQACLWRCLCHDQGTNSDGTRWVTYRLNFAHQAIAVRTLHSLSPVPVGFYKMGTQVPSTEERLKLWARGAC
jgi:hypothetical protein